MATVKRGTLVRSPEWWKHLRKRRAHRRFWKAQRQAERRLVRAEAATR